MADCDTSTLTTGDRAVLLRSFLYFSLTFLHEPRQNRRLTHDKRISSSTSNKKEHDGNRHHDDVQPEGEIQPSPGKFAPILALPDVRACFRAISNFALRGRR